VRRAAWLALACAACVAPPPDQTRVTVTIPRGASFDVAVESLAARGLVRSRSLFRAYARAHGLPGALKSGVYAFRPRESWSAVVATLKRGRGSEVRFTVPEGLMLPEVAELVRRQLGIPAESLLAAAGAADRLDELDITEVAQTVEGYLFPTTYIVPVGVRVGDLMRLMTRQFVAHWKPEWDARLDTLGLTRHQVVTLASIIQAEVRYAPDRGYVSAVYHNRLKRRMPLQADPTVIYAHGRRLRRVYEKHLRVRSPYNTYVHAGLPPGPIGQPGLASLEAALYPADAPYLFFVARSDGKHVFSVTYREHLTAIGEIRRRRGGRAR
jgi:UPF0755 protein